MTEVDRITIDDQNGDTVTQDVAITITGTNDEVLVSGAVATGAVVEDGTASAVGTVNFTDVDLTDDHVASSALQRQTTPARLAPSRRWNCRHHRQRQRWRGELERRDQQCRGQQLANGQAVTEVHRITIDDQNGDTVTQDVAIMITDEREALVSGAVATGARSRTARPVPWARRTSPTST